MTGYHAHPAHNRGGMQLYGTPPQRGDRFSGFFPRVDGELTSYATAARVINDFFSTVTSNATVRLTRPPSQQIVTLDGEVDVGRVQRRLVLATIGWSGLVVYPAVITDGPARFISTGDVSSGIVREEMVELYPALKKFVQLGDKTASVDVGTFQRCVVLYDSIVGYETTDHLVAIAEAEFKHIHAIMLEKMGWKPKGVPATIKRKRDNGIEAFIYDGKRLRQQLEQKDRRIEVFQKQYEEAIAERDAQKKEHEAVAAKIGKKRQEIRDLKAQIGSMELVKTNQARELTRLRNLVKSKDESKTEIAELKDKLRQEAFAATAAERKLAEASDFDDVRNSVRIIGALLAQNKSVVAQIRWNHKLTPETVGVVRDFKVFNKTFLKTRVNPLLLHLSRRLPQNKVAAGTKIVVGYETDEAGYQRGGLSEREHVWYMAYVLGRVDEEHYQLYFPDDQTTVKKFKITPATRERSEQPTKADVWDFYVVEE